MKKTCLYRLVPALVLVSALLWSCAPGKVVKTPESVFKQKNIFVSNEELFQWKNLGKSGKDSEERAQGNFWTGQYYYNIKDYKKAARYFLHNEKYYADVMWGYLSVLRLTQLLFDINKRDEAMGKYRVLLEKRHQFPAFKQQVLEELEKSLESFTQEGLDLLYEKHVHQVIDEYILYISCKRAIKENNFESFFKYSRVFLSEFKESKFIDEISKRFRDFVRYKPVDNKKIGVIIPLSGKAMDIGTIVRNGLELSLEEYNEDRQEKEKVSLIYIDEALGNLEENIIKAIEEYSVIGFIGPLFSKTVMKVIPVMERYNTILFSPTAAQPGLTDESEYFFRYCGTAKGQAYAMAEYVKNSTEFKNLGTIYPDNVLGQTLNRYFIERYTEKGGNIVRDVSYRPNKSDFKKQMVLLGGIDTIMLKEKRAKEKRLMNEAMEDAGKRILEKVFDYVNLYDAGKYTGMKEEDLPKITVSLLHFSPLGEHVEKFELDTEMTKKLSYTVAKNDRVKVRKQAQSDRAMEDIGVSAGDLDREIALNIAYQLDTDILIWGQIREMESNTTYANFLPEKVIDDKGTTRVVYNFIDEDFFNFDINLSVLSVSDEAQIDEIYIKYRKIKEPKLNPMEIDALYIPAKDRKMILLKDQLKFYDFDLPVFGSSSMSSSYINSFRENVQGTIYPVEYFDDADEENMKNFVERYREKFASNPNVIAANSYDVMKIMGALISRNINSRESFKNVLKSVRNYYGVTGRFSFDRTGDSIRDYYIMQMERFETKYIDKIRGE